MAPHDERGCPFDTPRVRASEIVEAGDFAAILNIAPIRPGHTLVIPKRHVAGLMDLSHEEYLEFFEFAREATRVLLALFDTHDFDWSLQDGYDAGQTVPHLHLHVIPRIANDLGDRRSWYRRLQAPIVQAGEPSEEGRPRLSEDELARLANELRERIRNLALQSTPSPQYSLQAEVS